MEQLVFITLYNYFYSCKLYSLKKEEKKGGGGGGGGNKREREREREISGYLRMRKISPEVCLCFLFQDPRLSTLFIIKSVWKVSHTVLQNVFLSYA